MLDFAKLTTEEAIAYCHKHANQYKADMFAADEDGAEAFDCLVGCLESSHIMPAQLPSYGMDYEAAEAEEKK